VYTRAVPVSGYEFDSWTGTASYSADEIHISDLRTDLNLVAHLHASDGPDGGSGTWFVLAPVVVVIVAFAIVILFLFGPIKTKK
jgi:hypothetical protein